jgi:hypothetical protein
MDELREDHRYPEVLPLPLSFSAILPQRLVIKGLFCTETTEGIRKHVKSVISTIERLTQNIDENAALLSMVQSLLQAIEYVIIDNNSINLAVATDTEEIVIELRRIHATLEKIIRQSIVLILPGSTDTEEINRSRETPEEMRQDSDLMTLQVVADEEVAGERLGPSTSPLPPLIEPVPLAWLPPPIKKEENELVYELLCTLEMLGDVSRNTQGQSMITSYSSSLDTRNLKASLVERFAESTKDFSYSLSRASGYCINCCNSTEQIIGKYARDVRLFCEQYK